MLKCWNFFVYYEWEKTDWKQISVDQNEISKLGSQPTDIKIKILETFPNQDLEKNIKQYRHQILVDIDVETKTGFPRYFRSRITTLF